MANLNLSEFTEKLFVADADHTFIWDSAASISKRVSRNSWLSGTTADFHLGLADAASPVAQTISVQSVVAGTSNTAGANFSINGSQGTGTGAGGALLLRTAPAGSSGTAQNALVTAVAITSAGNVGIGTTSPTSKLHVDGNALFGQNTTSPTLTPIKVSFGGTYGTSTAGSRANLKWEMYNDGIAANTYGIGMSVGVMEFQAGAAGGFNFYPNNTTVSALSIASSGAATFATNVFLGGYLQTGATQAIGFNGRSYLKSPSDGVITLVNTAETDFNRLQLGGTTDAFPAIARDGAGIKFTGAAAGSTSWIKVPPVAVSALPLAATAGAGARAFVNDALAPTFGSAVTGGGSVPVPVYSTGSAWNVG